MLARDFIVMRHQLSLAIWSLGCLMLAGTANVRAMPSPLEAGHAPRFVDALSGRTRLAQTQPTQAPAPAATPSPAQPATPAQADEPIGNVATLTGIATVIRNKDSIPLKLQDDIFMNDTLQTSANSTLGVTFNDATTFNLTANARITVDNYVYEDGGKSNAALFDVTKGTVAFVAAAVARTGDMTISTPTATLGIRGTTGLVEVPEGAAANNPNHVAIKLYPDPDGHVGRIEVNDRAGARLGFLTQGASGFTIRPGAGGRFAAQPLAISPQQALRDQSVVRQVHAAQSVGRQIVTQKRIERQQNPNRNNPARNNPAANPARQPGLPKQNGLPKQPGLQKQNGLPQRPGSPQQPVTPQPGSPNQPGQQGQPQQQPAPGLQRRPNAPGLRQPGLQNRPQLPRRPAILAPKGKLPKQRH
jgi:FecR protein